MRALARQLKARRWAALVALIAAMAAIGQAAFAQSGGGAGSEIDPEWVSAQVSEHPIADGVKNNLASGALAERDRAVQGWSTAVERYRAALRRARAAHGRKRTRLGRVAQKLAPNPFAKPEYVVVWMSNANAGDENYQKVQEDIALLSQAPAQFGADARNRFLPGSDGWAVIDARRRNADGSPNPAYGHVANFVQLPVPWGIEAEAHHMQYEWEDGQPLLAGGLFNTATFVLSTADVPNLELTNTLTAVDTPGGTIPDAYDAAGKGTFLGTYMGGAEPNYGGSPGEVVAFKPDPEKGLVVASETPAGRAGSTETDAPGKPVEPCNTDEGSPAGTCANPHGVQVRPDLGRAVTSDYGEPKAVVLDPVKFDGGRFYRPTVRIWNMADPLKPKLVSAAHMPIGWRDPQSASTMHLNRGIMENAKTWPASRRFPGVKGSKGFFAGAMCGGGIFFTPDVTKLSGDSSGQWKEVWDDGLSLLLARGGDVEPWLQDEGPCEGGAWMQVSRNNRYLFRIVTGGQPNSENLSGRGQPNKIVYNVDVRRLLRAARRGSVRCDIAGGIDLNRDRIVDLQPKDVLRRLAAGKQVADCPRLVSTLNVDDPTTGGPHWAALDNHSLAADGSPTRLVFADYFVSRSGIDGNHQLYSANISRRTGKLSYDHAWRDELTGYLGVNFNRQDWPGNPGGGFYKPHSMVWVCPPGVCPADAPSPGLGVKPPHGAKPKPRAHRDRGRRTRR